MGQESLADGPVEEILEIAAGEIDFDGDGFVADQLIHAANQVEALAQGGCEFRRSVGLARDDAHGGFGPRQRGGGGRLAQCAEPRPGERRANGKSRAEAQEITSSASEAALTMVIILLHAPILAQFFAAGKGISAFRFPNFGFFSPWRKYFHFSSKK
jgi:hypothetical protein